MTSNATAWLVQRLNAARSDSEAHPEGHSNRTFYAGQAIAYENVLSLLENEEPATPAPSSPGVPDSVREALEFYAYDKAVSYENSVHAKAALKALDSIVEPAQVVVPDSVRALSEAATRGAWVFERMHDDFVGVYSDDRTGSVIANFAGFHAAPRPKAEQDANARFAAEAVNYVRTLLSAHPAGQSTGKGAQKASDNLRPDWHRAMFPNDAAPEQGAGCPVCGSTPENLNEFGGWCEGVLTSQGDHTGICAKHGEPARLPTPDSTCTGAVAAEEANAVFDPARTSSDPYDDRPGPWYDMKKVREIEAATGIAFAAVRPEPVLGRATDELIEDFSAALKAKLRAAEAKYGWQNGWLKDDWAADCQRDLVRHVEKGDPLDVAAYAAFCWHHGWPTAPDSVRMGRVGAGDAEPWKTLALIRDFAKSSILVRNDALDHIYIVASVALSGGSPRRSTKQFGTETIPDWLVEFVRSSAHKARFHALP
ncbi:hypothetical protein FHR71_005623, partial [Methylobacterium sp. RAS18]|nr:hypothetical protein [Methylobacterium sp. RAS18]